MTTRRPRTGGFASSLSSSRYNNVSEKFKSVSSGRFGVAKRSKPALDYSQRFHESLRASLKVSQLGRESGAKNGVVGEQGSEKEGDTDSNSNRPTSSRYNRNGSII